MNSRERVLLALDHREADRVPFDMGGTVVTGINQKPYRGLRRALGLPERETALVDILQQIARVDDDVLDRLGVDVKNISPRSSATFQIDVKDGGDYTYFHDEFHIGWRMPKDGGLYYDMFEHPLAGPITTQDVDNFAWPDPLDPARFAGLKEAAEHVKNVEQRAVVVGSISAGIMEIFAWVRGFKDSFMDYAGNEKLAAHIMDKVLEMQIAYWDKMFSTIGDNIDVAATADDFAGQTDLLISPRTYRRLCKPRHKALFDFIHSHSRAKVFFHSCGAIRAVIPDLIEIGCDILNPVQVRATGMDSAELKREFGRDIVFWGGGVDTQRVLGEGTPQQVREEVKRRVTDLMPGGGFVFNTIHNIQPNVPVENIIAMWETLREYGVYQAEPELETR
jgi:uroporphyrinogen decarboxylase